MVGIWVKRDGVNSKGWKLCAKEGRKSRTRCALETVNHPFCWSREGEHREDKAKKFFETGLRCLQFTYQTE